jgi:hypothetical protein
MTLSSNLNTFWHNQNTLGHVSSIFAQICTHLGLIWTHIKQLDTFGDMKDLQSNKSNNIGNRFVATISSQ